MRSAPGGPRGDQAACRISRSTGCGTGCWRSTGPGCRSAELEVPIIAAVNGAAVGAGLCLALAGDLCYAPTAKLTAPFTRLGMHWGMAATWLLPQAGGIGLAREMLLTGRVVGAGRRPRRGVWSAGSRGVLGEALESPGRWPDAAPIATRLTKVALAPAARRASTPRCSGRRWPNR